ncbi:MAG: hypothetical protein DME25_08330 [Verrucomicrobia bacterium]|nr:MAG: hypothetical protein DME25_08330 [Verrucomicrobiota bacterium]
MKATREGANVLLAWPGVARGFFLEQRTSLAPGFPWQSVFDAVTIASNQNSVAQAAVDAVVFYRLNKP